jgi:hypothetical protein
VNQEQKKLILKEIQRWKESRLLPAEYCDFLMNLYAEGDSLAADNKGATGGSEREERGSRSWFGRS